MKPIIIIIYDFNIGGAQKSLIQLANLLNEDNDYTITVITIKNCGDLKDLLNNEINLIHLKNNRILTNIIPLLIKLKDFKNPFILTSMFGCGLLISLLKLIKNRKIKTIYREAANPMVKNNFLTPLLNKLIYILNDQIISNSTNVLKLIRDEYGIESKKLNLIRNPLKYVNNSKFISKQNNKIIFVGRLDPIKNIEIQLDAISYIKDEVEFHIYCTIVDKFYYEQIIEYILQKNLKDSVHFHFDISDPEVIFSDSKIILLTSHSEGFPNVILEALSYNTIPICFDIEYGPNEIIENNDVGILIPNDKFSSSSYLSDCIVMAKENFSINSNLINIKIEQFGYDNVLKAFKKIINKYD